MYTSNYDTCGKMDNAIAISSEYPQWFTGKVCRDLVPDIRISGLRPTQFIKAYMKQLDKLNPDKIITILGKDSIVLTNEDKGAFSSRRVFANWLEARTGMKVLEWEGITAEIKVVRVEKKTVDKIQDYSLF